MTSSKYDHFKNKFLWATFYLNSHMNFTIWYQVYNKEAYKRKLFAISLTVPLTEASEYRSTEDVSFYCYQTLQKATKTYCMQ